MKYMRKNRDHKELSPSMKRKSDEIISNNNLMGGDGINGNTIWHEKTLYFGELGILIEFTVIVQSTRFTIEAVIIYLFYGKLLVATATLKRERGDSTF
jgi:hypothetical protein